MMPTEGKAVWLSKEAIDRLRSLGKTKFGKLGERMSMNLLVLELLDEFDKKFKYRL